ncbi:cell surface glycoprotein CD200 receptor 2-like [Pteronotus mesoamericanus]|uniref:cell surface glycoprotein CD200 receptor 2-like n=1 Tax=Pteronotus mesoamericanus TaxID=1884717 RepID=UPI0023ECB8E9|nr:cell surface glycoprotein CD200 receptor 2-like [Pteronotus parnellii mesoamericanus]
MNHNGQDTEQPECPPIDKWNGDSQEMGRGKWGSASSGDRKQNHSKLPADVNTSLTVLEDTKAVLFCPPVLLTKAVVTTWEIILRDKPPCIKAHRRDKNETTEANCTDERITWTYRPDQSVTLQIDPVVIAHEGFYMCQVVTPDGNFHRGYYLRVLVAPEVTIFQSQNRTAVCKAVAGKPAAHIFWTPEGDCVPEHKYWENGTVTVQSTCFWAESNVSTVTCFVSHEAYNWSRSIELNQGAGTLRFPESWLLTIFYVKFSLFLVILVIVGFMCLQRINHYR